MNVSRLTFTKETKEKMNKPISHFEKGRLRWERLEELERTGKLNSARNRKDISSMLGLGDGYGAGYSWVSNMINRKHLSETLVGFNRSNQPEYEYHITNQPDYNFGGNTSKATKTRKKTSPVTKINIKSQSTEPEKNTARVVIRYKELTIELEEFDVKIIENIIEKLADR